MLKILPIQEKEKQRERALACGVPFRPDALAYEATVGDALVGICQFSTGGVIYDLAAAPDTNDREALFIMARQTLNFIDLCGTHHAVFRGECDPSLLSWIGFRETDDGYAVDLSGFFDHPCEHRKEK